MSANCVLNKPNLSRACFAALSRPGLPPDCGFRACTVVVRGLVVLAVFAAMTFAANARAADEADADDQDAEVHLTLIQIGDLHGHMVPRPNLRIDSLDGVKEGGLARIAGKIKQIRASDPDALLFNVGDTIQGGAEALYTSGQAMVDVLDTFGIDGFAPGNWEYLYGSERFVGLFGSGRWGAVAANLYYEDTGERVLPPYLIKAVNGVKIGYMGLTTDRGLPAIPNATEGLVFTGDAAEIPVLIDKLRNEEMVDVVILLSEFGLAKNVLLAERYPGMDVVLSADMHEITPRAVVTSTGTLVFEVGQDGTRMGKVVLRLVDKRIVSHAYKFINIDATIEPDPETAKLVREIRKAFVTGSGFRSHMNPISGAILNTPINTVVGTAEVGLHRSNFSDDPLPGVIEGTSHDFLTDAFRDQGMSDFASIRGFRYGTHVRPGPIRLQDLYHYLPTGAQIARGTIPGLQLKTVIENTINGSLNKDPFKWGGGWVFGFSGVSFDLDLTAPRGFRAQNIMIKSHDTGLWEPLDVEADYTVSGFYFDDDPNRVGAFRNAKDITVLKAEDGGLLDGTEVVVDHLETHTANPQTGRIRLLQPLPPPVYGNPEIQPLLGATAD